MRPPFPASSPHDTQSRITYVGEKLHSPEDDEFQSGIFGANPSESHEPEVGNIGHLTMRNHVGEDAQSQGEGGNPGVPHPEAAHPRGMPALACDGCGLLGKELASVGEAGSALLLCIRCYDEAAVTVRLR